MIFTNLHDTLFVVATGPSCSSGSMWRVSVSVITVP